MKNQVLVLNCGSSSIKFAIIDAQSGQAALSGLAENLGNADCQIKLEVNGNKQRITLPANSQHKGALEQIQNALADYPELQRALVAVGHRVVHGGETFTASCLIDEQVKQAIVATSHMAPLHNPANLIGIESAEQAFADLPHVAVFDTAFFQSMAKTAYLYALPYKLYSEHGIRRYGFHGSSHRFVSQQASQLLGKPAANLITAHLGNGCSVAAIRAGQGVDISMGFTPLEGLVMGSRCGDLDPSLPSYLIEQLGYNAEQVTNLLNKASGLLGISELSNDCRTLEQAAEQGHSQAKLALEIFCYRLAKYIGSYLVALGAPLDALVFTGGIGENSQFIRQTTLTHLAHLGFAADAELNSQMRFGQSGAIQAQHSPAILVIATNEEWVIAQDALQLSQTTL